MRIQSGICIESNQDRSVFLVKNGEFVRGTPTGTPLIGEEAFFYPFEKQPLLRWQSAMAPVLAAVAALAFFVSALAFPKEEAFNYVQVEINPGIELGLNDQYEVVSIRELNSDGHDLIHELGNWKNDSVTSVLDRVFVLAVTEQTQQITITSVEEDGNNLDRSIKEFVLALSSVAKNENIAIQMKEATRAQWRQSKEDLVPMGQLIDKAETLKIQKEPEVQVPVRESEPNSTPKEESSINEQETSNDKKAEDPIQQNNESKETTIQKETNEPKSPEKKVVPPIVEKKSEAAKPEPQKTPEQTNMKDKPSEKNENTPPVKKQHEEPKPKEVPFGEEEQKTPAESEQKESEAPRQQKKDDAPNATSSTVEKESRNLSGQEKNKKQPPGKEKQKEQEKKDNAAKQKNQQNNNGKE